MKSWSSALIGLGIGGVLGYLFGIRRGDWWIGGSIAVTSSIAAYGFLAYPQYRFKWSGPHSKFWYTLLSVLAPIIMLLTPISPRNWYQGRVSVSLTGWSTVLFPERGQWWE